MRCAHGSEAGFGDDSFGGSADEGSGCRGREPDEEGKGRGEAHCGNLMSGLHARTILKDLEE